MADTKLITTITVSSDPKVMSGTWCIEGTRIPVEVPFDLVDRDSIQPEDLAYFYPSLKERVMFTEVTS